MTNTFQLRRLAIYLLILPLALLVGFFVSTPDSSTSLMVIAAVFGIGCIPFLMKWHHPLLIISWNATLLFYYLPGQFSIWLIMVFVSLFFSVWKRTLNRENQMIVVPFVWWPLISLSLVVLATFLARRELSLDIGYHNETRRYLIVIAQILGFFALSFQKIPKRRAILFGGLFFLSGTTAAISDLIYQAGPKFYFLYSIFPAGLAFLQAGADFGMGEGVFRLEGIAWASVAFSCFMLLRYGARGILDVRRPWRIIVFLAALVLGLFGGFRSRLLLIGMFFVVQFCLEGLWKTRLLPILLGLGVLVAVAILPFIEKLPQPIQRALSFLPVEVDANVRRDAAESVDWRVEMWRVVSADVPKYFWIGKGFVYSESDHYLTQLAEYRGYAKSYESFILLGEYHNGPLSVIIPFGIWGLLAFIWFVIAGGYALFLNYRYCDKDFQNLNTFLLTYYIVRAIFFFVIFGSFHSELMLLTGVVGLSVSINGGVRRRSVPDAIRRLPEVDVVPQI